MSRSVNKITLIGNVGADPEIRTTPNGSKVAQFSLATSRSWKSSSGEAQERTEWHKCLAWNVGNGKGLADVIERYVKKGDKLFLEGRIEYRTYEKDGEKRYVTEVLVRELVMLGNKHGETKPNAAAEAAAGVTGGEPNDDLPF